jgi:hypothetical protein
MKHPKGIDLLAPIKPARYQEHRNSSSVMETVSGLREWEVLGGKCGRCGHIAWLDRNKVIQRYGNQYLHNIDAKLVCRCGNRHGNTMLVGTLGRD